MGFFSFVEGPLLWIVLLVFATAILARFCFFLAVAIKTTRSRGSKWDAVLVTVGRLFVPFHMGALKNPGYTALRLVFHFCLVIVPVWFSGHVFLWESSILGWYWTPIPDQWAHWLTLLFLALTLYFLVRRLIFKDIRISSSAYDYILLIVTALPFVTGYFLTHGTLEGVPFLGYYNMWIIHIFSGCAMILVASFLFCRTRMDPLKCTGCAACELACPTGTIESFENERVRTFRYSHYQCICCGSCVSTCPEEAAQLRHEISIKRFFQILGKQEIRTVELKECMKCGEFFSPQPLLEKIQSAVAGEYLNFCPRCRKINLGDILRQISPWHRPGQINTHRFPRSHTDKTAAVSPSSHLSFVRHSEQNGQPDRI